MMPLTLRKVTTTLSLAAAAFVSGAGAEAQQARLTQIIGVPGGTLRPQPGISTPAGITRFERPEWFTELVPTDPLVRQIQVGPAPVAVLSGVDLGRGVGIAAIPGAGSRAVRVAGPVRQTAAGPAVQVVDAATGVQMLALLPDTPAQAETGPLVPATVVRVTADGAILEREAGGRRITEILPRERVYSRVGERFVPAATVRRLRPGAQVYIPLTGGARGTITVTPPAGFRTRALSQNARARR